MSEQADGDEAIFEQLLKLSSAQAQEAYLQEAFPHNSASKKRLLGLLQAYGMASPNPEQASNSSELGPRSEQAGCWIGRYKLVQQIGEGGFGAVWMAEQEEPVRRQVALKVIKLGMDTRQVIARFEAERQALALMDHPSIARVFDGGATELGRPYFVMELVRGIPITTYCDQHQLPTPDRLQLFRQVCVAVQHAHQKGLIHRDLKPSNILVTEQDDRPVPKVIDFGVAKATEGRLTDKTLFTGFQQVIGTPAYMSPEQAGLGSLDIDTRSDIYSLGVVLYELVTGETPLSTKEISKGGFDTVLRAIREADPPKPSTRLSRLLPEAIQSVADQRQTAVSKLLGLVRGDLDWIIMKALEKDRSRRYETANSLALEIDRYLHDEPVLARPPNAAYRWKKFARKHRTAVRVAAGFLVMLCAATVISLSLAMWANQERVRAKKAETASKENETKAVERLWEAYLAQARANRWSGRLGQRFDSLDAIAKAAAIRPSIELRNEAIGCMTLPDLRQGRSLKGAFPTATRALDATFERYVWSDETGNIFIHSLPDDQEVRVVPGPGVWAWNTEFSPDGRFMISTYNPNTRPFPNELRLWDLTQKQVVLQLSNCWGDAYFRPQHREFVVHFQEKQSSLFDLQTLQEIRPLELINLPNPTSVFTSDGQLLAVSCPSESRVRIVDLQTGRLLRELDHAGTVRRPGWHPKKRWLACPCDDGNIYLWDVESGELVNTFRNHQLTGSQAKFNHRGDLLISSAWDSTVRLWDVSRAEQLLVMSVRKPLLLFSPDETIAGLLMGEADHFALLEASTASECRPLRPTLSPNQPAIQCGAISADGRLLAAGSTEGLRFWDLHTDDELLFVSLDPLESLAFLPDQSALITCGDGGVLFWPLSLETGDRLLLGPSRRLLPPGVFRALCLTADGRRLSVSEYTSPEATYPRHNLVLDLNSTNSPIVIKGPNIQSTSALSPDGRWLAAGIWRGTNVLVWDVDSGHLVRELPVPDSCFFPRFSPDGRWLAAGTAVSFQCWKNGTWTPGFDVKPDAQPTSQPSRSTFSPDGKMIAVYHRFNRTHLIDADQGRVLATLDLDRHAPLCFSPDGSSLALATEGGQLKILDLRIIRKQLAAMNLDWETPPFPPAPPQQEPKRLSLSLVE